MPIDIKVIRNTPEVVKKSQRLRFKDDAVVDQVLELDELWRKSNYKTETLRMEFGVINKKIADRKKASKGKDLCADLMEEAKVHRPKIGA